MRFDKYKIKFGKETPLSGRRSNSLKKKRQKDIASYGSWSSFKSTFHSVKFSTNCKPCDLGALGRTWSRYFWFKCYLRMVNVKNLILTIARNGCQPTILPQTWSTFLLQRKNLPLTKKGAEHILLRRQTPQNDKQTSHEVIMNMQNKVTPISSQILHAFYKFAFSFLQFLNAFTCRSFWKWIRVRSFKHSNIQFWEIIYIFYYISFPHEAIFVPY